MAKQDYYEILGISKSATQAEIKKGYRKMAIKYHPDKNPDDKSAEEKFKACAEAYEILSDENKKARYDQYGHAAFDGPQGGGGGFGGGGMNMDDIFNQFGDIFGNGGGGFGGFGGGGHQRQARVKGSNMRIRVKLTLEEIATGVEKKVKVRRKVQAEGVTYKTCSTCNGSGQQMRVTNTILGRMQQAVTCNTCQGAGEIINNKPNGADAQGLIVKEETVSINIPEGVSEGVQLKVGGKGNEAPGKNSIPGDLLVVIEELPHENLKREGSNIHYDLYINFSEAVLGVSKEVETVTGKVKIKIEAGTQSGKILRLKGKGLPSIERYGIGDFLIHINVWTPQELTKEQRKFFEQMQEDDNFSPNPQKSDKSFFEKVKDMFS
ncbi:molecular chaperone DnaJ [Tenacibaculum piscium]|uniref:Chaperone protein DnaJ n=1 Tax=Tenacibaculum piscium TaxID=1458515 RepID=A0A2H1YJV5_9FLAO|nr:molecular chaperone DnaJ [Tenacibaculum piscium]MBE7630369.1 molecular chaperone DnaJ [Tenacibaculum piscium]MBE7671383.1 molecular chaperone DnaJ [Tenacibaculum piscium]MBE7690941.1 molecular chaperone DnaJ [Tenacibaculum piscium]MCG8184305.1 molecular chaperone DnaJ [Tenacibaculum piscium]MCG8205698.1 molecular chaperone DnaJ [Tenacibaculum piscium]